MEHDRLNRYDLKLLGELNHAGCSHSGVFAEFCEEMEALLMGTVASSFCPFSFAKNVFLVAAFLDKN
jgi:hypothetical protein